MVLRAAVEEAADQRRREVLAFHPASGEPQAEILFQHRLTLVIGRVDGLAGAAVRGWAYRTHVKTGEKTGAVTLEVWQNGVKLG